MNTRDSLLAALPALILGLGAGYLFSSMLAEHDAEASGRGASAEPSNAALERAPTARKDVLAAAPLETARGVAEAPAEPAPPAVSERELARALETVHAPSIAASRGSGVISGTALDEDGAPLSGVTILGSSLGRAKGSNSADVGKAAPDDTSLEEHLRDAADAWARSRAGRRRAVTGADGGYELTNIEADGSYRLSAYREGYVLDAEGSAYAVAPGSRVNFTAAPVFTLPVELVYAAGGRPDEGQLQVKRGNSTELYAWTPDAPELRTRPGRIALRGFSDAGAGNLFGRDVAAAFASEEVDLDVAESAGVPQTLVLAPRSGIRGRVVDGSSASDRPMVRMMPVADGASVDLEALATADQTWPQNDRFAFYDLAPGTYAVGLGSWGEPILVHEVVAVGAGIVDVELVVPAPDPEQTLFVRALGPDGAPLRDLDFGWRYERSHSSSSGGIQGRRQPDGAWALRPKVEFFAPWTPETKFTLTVSHAQFGSREAVLAEGQREVEVTFAEPVTIVLVVGNYAGSGYEGRLSAGCSQIADGEPSRSTTYYSSRGGGGQFGADGVARFETLAPGAWRITLSLNVGDHRTRSIGSQDVSVSSGEKTVRMDIPVLFDLAVVAPDLSAGTQVYLRPIGDGPRAFGPRSYEQLDADKRAVFRSLLAGTYQLSGSGSIEPLEVTVPCGEVLLDAREPNCYRVAIGDLEGMLYTSGLRAGDLIVGMNGKRFETLSQATALFQGSEAVALIVSRGGAELTVSIPGGLFANGADPGGMLTPTRLP